MRSVYTSQPLSNRPLWKLTDAGCWKDAALDPVKEA